MGKSNLLNTRTANLLELVSNGRIYRVPQFQRDYSSGRRAMGGSLERYIRNARIA